MIHHRFLTLAAATILVAACGPAPKNGEAPKGDSISYDLEEQASVFVTVEGNKVKVDQQTVTLQETKAGKKFILWTLFPRGSGELKIEMKNPSNSPFPPPKHAKDQVLSFRPRAGSGGTGSETYKIYHYNVIVTLTGSTTPLPTLDPDIRVDR
jgi:hypothetical protein